MEYYLAIKKNKIGSFEETQMDLQTIHTKWSKERKINTV